MNGNEMQRLVADMARNPNLAALLRRQAGLAVYAAVARSQGYAVTEADVVARVWESLASPPPSPAGPEAPRLRARAAARAGSPAPSSH